MFKLQESNEPSGKVRSKSLLPFSLPGNLALFFILIILLSSFAFAQGSPVIPASFYGSATINGRAIPAGSTITAEIDGIQKGSSVTRTAGKYGELAEGRLAVQSGEEGDTIIFYIQTTNMSGKLPASERATWRTGDVKEINLTFTGTESNLTLERISNDTSRNNTARTNTTTVNENPVQPTKQMTPEGVEVEVYNLDEAFSAGDTVILTLNKGDIVQFTLAGSLKSLTLTAIGPGEVLLSSGSETVSVKMTEPKDIDMNSDATADISVRLTSTSNNKAKMSFKRLFQTSPLTGFVALSPTTMGIVAFALIAGGVAFLHFRKEKPGGRGRNGLRRRAHK